MLSVSESRVVAVAFGGEILSFLRSGNFDHICCNFKPSDKAINEVTCIATPPSLDFLPRGVVPMRDDGFNYDIYNH